MKCDFDIDEAKGRMLNYFDGKDGQEGLKGQILVTSIMGRPELSNSGVLGSRLGRNNLGMPQPASVNGKYLSVIFYGGGGGGGQDRNLPRTP